MNMSSNTITTKNISKNIYNKTPLDPTFGQKLLFQ